MNISLQLLIGKKRVHLSLEHALAQSFLYSNFHLSFFQNTCEIAIADDRIAFVCESDHLINNMSGNIEFYDFNGNKLANIKDIVGETNDVYTGVYLHSSESLAFCKQALNDNHVYCVCNTWNDNHYIIDLNEMRLIEKYHSR